MYLSSVFLYTEVTEATFALSENNLFYTILIDCERGPDK